MSGDRWVELRRGSQTACAALFVLILWTTTYPARAPESAAVLFKLDPLLTALVALSRRVVPAGWGWGALMLGATAVLGRYFCGWMCPLGFCGDLAAHVRPDRKWLEAEPRWRWLKYAVLGVLVAAAAGGLQLAWVADPVVIAGRFASLNLIPGLVRGTDLAFAWAIRTFHLYGAPYDAYRWLKAGPLNVNAHFFAHALWVLAMFASIVAAAGWSRRFWCRNLCPLGALYALASVSPWLRRSTSGCIGCGVCREDCRMHAVRGRRGDYDPGECVLCMDCVPGCPADATTFRFRGPQPAAVPVEGGPHVSRAQFLAFGAGAAVALVPAPVRAAAAAAVRSAPTFGPPRPVPTLPIRPPGAVPEVQFVDRCVRCGSCMKVCMTNGLLPAVSEAGWRGLWTPRMVPEIGYCEFSCTLCGQVCPTGAIAKLPLKKKREFVMGLAWFDRNVCLPWAKNQACLVCEEHCPVPEKAIKLDPVRAGGRRFNRPRVDPKLCTGCGICTYKCPVRPQRGVLVFAAADHDAAAIRKHGVNPRWSPQAA